VNLRGNDPGDAVQREACAAKRARCDEQRDARAHERRAVAVRPQLAEIGVAVADADADLLRACNYGGARRWPPGEQAC